MGQDAKNAALVFLPEQNILKLEGNWTLLGIYKLNHEWLKVVHKFKKSHHTTITIEAKDLNGLDSAGVWLLKKILSFLKHYKITIEWQNFDKKEAELFQLFDKALDDCTRLPRSNIWPWLANLGLNFVNAIKQALLLLNFIGDVFVTFINIILKPLKFSWRMFFNTIQTTGFNALPIIGLLSFLIGVVLAYQMGLQLRNYGGNVYIVDLMGLAVCREFAPLMTAIIIAGRSGSAFTAQIGTMLVNQEIDALMTMGIKPVERLVLPKIIGLVISLPLLAVWSDFTGIVGGMIVSKQLLHVDYIFFFQRFHQVIPLRWFVIGVCKAPVFALLIATVGCFQGLQVERNADSVGRHTTKSVVQAIFLIICMDAVFSFLFDWAKL